MSRGIPKTDKSYLNPDDMAFRAIYYDFLKREKIKTIFRPGKRKCGASKGFCKGQHVNIRVIKVTGTDNYNIPPKFYSKFTKKAVIREVKIARIKNLKKEDFVNSCPDINNKKSLIYHLGIIYNLSPSKINNESFVTVTKFDYI